MEFSRWCSQIPRPTSSMVIAVTTALMSKYEEMHEGLIQGGGSRYNLPPITSGTLVTGLTRVEVGWGNLTIPLPSYLPPHYTSLLPYELHRSSRKWVGQTLVADYLLNTWILQHFHVAHILKIPQISPYPRRGSRGFLRFCDPWLHIAYGVPFQFPTAD